MAALIFHAIAGGHDKTELLSRAAKYFQPQALVPDITQILAGDYRGK